MIVKAIARGMYLVTDRGRQWTVAIAGPADNRWVWVDGQVAKIDAPEPTLRRRGGSAHQDLSAPMPATVVRALVSAGDRVARGDTLLILEAMKMELPIRAPQDGVVKAVLCQAGELVQPGTNLIELES